MQDTVVQLLLLKYEYFSHRCNWIIIIDALACRQYLNVVVTK